MARTGIVNQAVQVEAQASEAEGAGDVADAITTDSAGGIVLTFPDGKQVPLPESLVRIVEASARELASGHSLTVLPSDAMLTPAEAAKVLGLSRPFVTGLLDDGTIPSERLPGSRHRRIRLADVLAFAATRDRRGEGRRRVAEAVQDADLPY